MIEVITVTNNIGDTMPLVESLLKHNWRHSIIETEWKGFGTKLIKTYEYLKLHPEIEAFVFCDAFDVVCLGGEDEFKGKVGKRDMLVSAERGCWPVPDLEKLYANKFEHGFNFVNSGLYYAKSQFFIELFESSPPSYETDDQLWLSERYLDEAFMIGIDNECEAFQSYSFIRDGDYQYTLDNRLYNNWNKSFPIFVHGNGRTNMDKVRNLLK